MSKIWTRFSKTAANDPVVFYQQHRSETVFPDDRFKGSIPCVDTEDLSDGIRTELPQVEQENLDD